MVSSSAEQYCFYSGYRDFTVVARVSKVFDSQDLRSDKLPVIDRFEEEFLNHAHLVLIGSSWNFPQGNLGLRATDIAMPVNNRDYSFKAFKVSGHAG